MSDTLRVALIQVNSKADREANYRRAEELIDEAAGRGAQFAVLPEYINYLGPKEGHADVAETVPGPTTERFGTRARQHGIWLLGGSIHELSDESGKYYNTAVLYSPSGEIVATYRKIHLFDIDLTGNVTANESDSIVPGEEIVVADVDGHKVGLSICYDLRFPELYRQMALEGAEILLVPAAFTMFTGKDHWHVLLRARAIENQTYVLAAGQFGPHDPNAQCYGHSIVIDPWGTVIAEASDREGVVVADLDFEYLRKIRKQLPSLANRRPAAYRERAMTMGD